MACKSSKAERGLVCSRADIVLDAASQTITWLGLGGERRNGHIVGVPESVALQDRPVEREAALPHYVTHMCCHSDAMTARRFPAMPSLKVVFGGSAPSQIGHERETNPGGHDVRHRASPHFNDVRLDTQYEKSHPTSARVIRGVAAGWTEYDRRPRGTGLLVAGTSFPLSTRPRHSNSMPNAVDQS